MVLDGVLNKMIDSFFIDKIHKFGEELSEEITSIQNKVFDVKYKEDSSPLTEADIHANKRIKQFLLDNYEICTFVSEEDKLLSFEQRSQWGQCWIIDPIDGTKEFVKGGDDFCVNIALCKNKKPIYGHVIRPKTKDQYYAIKDQGAYKNRQKITCSAFDNSNVRIVASKSHLNQETQDYIDEVSKKYPTEIVNIGSALKICLVAEGKADVYPRYGPTMEWDTCAPQIILEEAGGHLINLQSLQPLEYNNHKLLNPYFIAYNNKGLCPKFYRESDN